MTNVIHPRAFARAPVARPDERAELLAGARLLQIAAEQPERRAEIVAAVADVLASMGRVVR